jgi:hypothetical protein
MVKNRTRKPITLRLPPKDNFSDWYIHYGPMMEKYYHDFTKLFINTEPPKFLEFMEYCYINTKSFYNSTKNSYERRIY